MEIARQLQLAPLLAMNSFISFWAACYRQNHPHTSTILEDTLIGFLLPAWIESKKRKAIKTGKFYFFDPGVTHMLAGTETLDPNSNLFGKSFEQFICMELRAYLSYRRKKLPLTYWRSKNGHEVDFLLGTKTAIEVKASKRISRNDFKGLKYLKEEGVFKNLILVSRDPISSLTNILSYQYVNTRPLVPEMINTFYNLSPNSTDISSQIFIIWSHELKGG